MPFSLSKLGQRPKKTAGRPKKGFWRGRWINGLKDNPLSKYFSNISQIYLKNFSTNLQQNFSNIFPLMYQSMAEGPKSQPAGLAKDSAQRDELFASFF